MVVNKYYAGVYFKHRTGHFIWSNDIRQNGAGSRYLPLGGLYNCSWALWGPEVTELKVLWRATNEEVELIIE